MEAVTPVRKVEIVPGLNVGPGEPLLVIAGPCQIESLEHCLKIGTFLKELCGRFKLNFVFKSSYDKANRTSLGSKRGPGLEEGLSILSQVKSRLGVPVLTDVHTTEQAQATAEVADILQTPAFLCRQTDFLTAVGSTGKPVNIKKGQFLHPSDMRQVSAKVASTGNQRLLLCERGTCFGYRDLVVDMRSLAIMRAIGYPVIFDATHSVQEMGGSQAGHQGSSAGHREFIQPLARAATAVGIDGLFFECHEAPEKAPSDGASMLPLNQVEALLNSVASIRSAAKI